MTASRKSPTLTDLHNACERERRRELKTGFDHLLSLLPPRDPELQIGRASKVRILDAAADLAVRLTEAERRLAAAKTAAEARKRRLFETLAAMRREEEQKQRRM